MSKRKRNKNTLENREKEKWDKYYKTQELLKQSNQRAIQEASTRVIHPIVIRKETRDRWMKKNAQNLIKGSPKKKKKVSIKSSTR